MHIPVKINHKCKITHRKAWVFKIYCHWVHGNPHRIPACHHSPSPPYNRSSSWKKMQCKTQIKPLKHTQTQQRQQKTYNFIKSISRRLLGDDMIPFCSSLFVLELLAWGWGGRRWSGSDNIEWIEERVLYVESQYSPVNRYTVISSDLSRPSGECNTYLLNYVTVIFTHIS